MNRILISEAPVQAVAVAALLGSALWAIWVYQIPSVGCGKIKEYDRVSGTIVEVADAYSCRITFKRRHT
jgi:hypothetical protein